MSSEIHEAGHAVLLMALGRRFERVTRTAVLPGGECDQAMIHLAGVAAQVIGGDDGEEAWKRASVDGERARECAIQALRERGVEVTTEAVKRELQADWWEVMTILRKRWRGVLALARLLKQLGEMDYDVVVYLFKGMAE